MNISDKLSHWLEPSLMAPDDWLIEKLESLAEEYYNLSESGDLTVGKIDEIFATSDKIQAELFRRMLKRKQT